MMKGEGSRKICGDEAGRTEEIERWTRQETKRKSKMGGGYWAKEERREKVRSSKKLNVTQRRPTTGRCQSFTQSRHFDEVLMRL